MKLLATLPNTNPATTPFPYGEIRDDTGSDDGTRANRALLTDRVQFFERLFALSGMTSNNTDDNADDGFQLVEALFNLLPKKFVFESTTELDGDVQTITRAQIEAARNAWGGSDLRPFGQGLSIASATPNGFVDFQIEVWILNGTDWSLLSGSAGAVGSILSSINTTGDIQITFNGSPFPSPVDVRVILIG